jgi:hypothetical protein
MKSLLLASSYLMVLMPVSLSPVTRLSLSILFVAISTVNKLYGVAHHILLSPDVTSMALLYGKCSLHNPMAGTGCWDDARMGAKKSMMQNTDLTLQI